MSKESNDNYLFELIHSLSKQEKRYFYLFAQKNTIKGKNNCLQLFKVLEKQKTYDEKYIYKKLKHESFNRHLNVTKYQLGKLILKSMHVYHAHSSVDATINELIHNAEFFANKKMIPQSLKQLAVAKKLAKANEKFSHLTEITRIEQWITRQGTNEEIQTAYLSETKKILDQHYNLFEYTTLFNKITLLSQQQGAIRDEGYKKTFEALLKNPLMQHEKNALSVTALRNMYAAYVSYYFSTTEYKKAYEYTKKIIVLTDKYSAALKADMQFYIVSISMHLTFCTHLNKSEEALFYINKMRTIKTTYFMDHLNIFGMSYNAEFNIYMSTRDFESALKCIEKFEAPFEKVKNKLNKITSFLLSTQLAYIHFVAGNNTKALKCINESLSSSVLNVNQHLELRAKLMDLFIHYDLANYNLLEYKIKSLYRYLFKKNRLHKTESILLTYIKKTSQAQSEKQINQLFQELKLSIETLLSDPLEKHFIDQLDILLWLESKIRKKPMLEIIKERDNS